MPIYETRRQTSVAASEYRLLTFITHLIFHRCAKRGILSYKTPFEEDNGYPSMCNTCADSTGQCVIELTFIDGELLQEQAWVCRLVILTAAHPAIR